MTDIQISEDNENNIVFINKPSLFLDSFYSVPHAEPEIKSISKPGWRVWILLTILLITGIWKIIPESAEHRSEQLMTQGQYRECAAVANQYLSLDSNNQTLCDIGAEAMVKDILHVGWLDKIDNGQFDDAKTMLTEAAEFSRHNPEGMKVVRALNWIADMEEYFYQRKTETPLVIFQDETRLKSLLRRWKKDKDNIRDFFCALTAYSHEDTWNKDIADQLQTRVFRGLDKLQIQNLFYVGDIEELKKAVQLASKPDQLKIIEQFRRRFPGIGGLEAMSQSDKKGEQP
ncbi:MAG: hypothetical protein BWK80_12220 [Desulfobacteraceae bacterium IS3]|nr:MAG: hypothetical protein BWK80_12220 [Desulfobacteraceae bacterium IS3]